MSSGRLDCLTLSLGTLRSVPSQGHWDCMIIAKLGAPTWAEIIWGGSGKTKPLKLAASTVMHAVNPLMHIIYLEQLQMAE